MNTNLKKNLTILFWIILIVGFYAVNVVINQTLMYFGEPLEGAIKWSEDIMALQLTIIILRCLSLIGFFGGLIVFILFFIQGIKEGILFPRKNIPLLFVCTTFSFVYFLSTDNLHIVKAAERYFTVTMDALLVPSIILIFTFLYKAAVQINEENRLTI